MNWLKRPPRPFEAPLLAAGGFALITAVGWVLNREIYWILLIAAAASLGIIATSWLWYREGWWKLVLAALVVATIVTGANFRSDVQTILRSQEQVGPLPSPVTRMPQIQISPCSSIAPQLARRPDGAYICLYQLPPDPKTGPVIASPRAR